MLELEKRHPFVFARTLQESLARYYEEASREVSEFGRFTNWLVGLSAALVAVAAINPDRLRTLLPDAYQWVAVGLLGTISFGILYRVIGLWVSIRRRRIHWWLCQFLAGYVSAPQIHKPVRLSEYWTEEDICKHMLTEFDLDYTFLLEEPKESLERLRRIYNETCDSFISLNEKGVAVIQKALDAHDGRMRVEIKRRVKKKHTGHEESEIIRRYALRTRIYSAIGVCAFLTMCVCFVMAMALVAKGL